MAERVKKLNLPKKTVRRLIKETLPESVFLGKDVEEAVTKAGMMFVLRITSLGLKITQKNNRKMLSAQDVIDALEQAEFEQFNEPLKELLAASSKTRNNEDHEEDEEIEEEDEEIEEEDKEIEEEDD